MSDETYSLQQLVGIDTRYPVEAYLFVREALAFAADSMELGSTCVAGKSASETKRNRRERHLSGQELCEAIRLYALKQYGYMSKVVLNRWGIYETSDFGEIVYNMIDVGIMKKSSRDRRSHFNNVYAFNEAFENQFQICGAHVPWKKE
jgi:uncharacterized repeat protein (TIGR04138 family)